MAIEVQCSCGTRLKVKDQLAGKKIKCPSCQAVLLVPVSDARSQYQIEDDPLPAKRQSKRKVSREQDDNENLDHDGHEDDDQPRRRRRRRVKQVATPILPLVYGVLSVLCPCLLAGGALGGLAVARANFALGELPDGASGRTARRNMQIARILGIVGICLSTIVTIIAFVLNITNPVKK
jgi:hypothetical protein